MVYTASNGTQFGKEFYFLMGRCSAWELGHVQMVRLVQQLRVYHILCLVDLIHRPDMAFTTFLTDFKKKETINTIGLKKCEITNSLHHLSTDIKIIHKVLLLFP